MSKKNKDGPSPQHGVRGLLGTRAKNQSDIDWVNARTDSKGKDFDSEGNALTSKGQALLDSIQDKH